MTNDVIESIKQWQEKKISGASLQRRLIFYDKWLVPISEQSSNEALATNSMPQVIFARSQEGKSSLFIFSDDECLAIFNKTAKNNAITHIVQTDGRWIFNLELENLDEIVIDPYSEHNIWYKKEQFSYFKDLYKAIEIENILYQLRFGAHLTLGGQKIPEGSVAAVGKYESYLLAIDQSDDPRVHLAPDNENRRLLAIFTAQDAFENYQQNYQSMPLKLNGQELCQRASMMDIDGLVFNSAGLQPIAFAKGFCQVVLGELSK